MGLIKACERLDFMLVNCKIDGKIRSRNNYKSVFNDFKGIGVIMTLSRDILRKILHLILLSVA
jgi:hypothetical protein